MKLGIVSDEQFEMELRNSHALNDVGIPLSVDIKPGELDTDNQVVEKSDGADGAGNNGNLRTKGNKGRAKGDVNVPENLRKLIGEESVIHGRQSALELAADFGISSSSVSAYAVGSTSTKTYHDPNKTLTNYLAARKARITKKSLRVLTNSLDELTPERLKGIKARDLAAIAKDMSTISNNMSDKNESESANKPQFVIYAPQVRDERSYEQIIVTDNF